MCSIIPFIFYTSRNCKLSYSDRKQISVCLEIRCGEGIKEKNYTGAQGNIGGEVFMVSTVVLAYGYACTFNSLMLYI